MIMYFNILAFVISLSDFSMSDFNIWTMIWWFDASIYRSGTVNSKSFVGKDFLQNKWKYELTIILNIKW